MPRIVSLAMKKKIGGKQHFKCANKPGSNISGLEQYDCSLWKIDDDDKGCFDEAGYKIDHIIKHAISHNDNEENFQVLCKTCHSVKTTNFKMIRNKKDDKKLSLKKN